MPCPAEAWPGAERSSPPSYGLGCSGAPSRHSQARWAATTQEGTKSDPDGSRVQRGRPATWFRPGHPSPARGTALRRPAGRALVQEAVEGVHEVTTRPTRQGDEARLRTGRADAPYAVERWYSSGMLLDAKLAPAELWARTTTRSGAQERVTCTRERAAPLASALPRRMASPDMSRLPGGHHAQTQSLQCTRDEEQRNRGTVCTKTIGKITPSHLGHHHVDHDEVHV